ncbi:phenylacetate-CoA oxygenase subunit PaaI [Photorhabdus luminescens]|uniref:1,2-phenylacetyl-CoA epoxidase subunit PaaC n=1 Tax=Photorhabdus akhurstii TaxID=171438 RepID=UPI000CF934C6|nr:phenylacetate-CoA oxygenase subunit PaaI [Photorhabdus luminescens]PQQ34045.1 phenylacetate-CoA oxygenase subunit PaaI [Photorhabdus luminescens]
MKLASGLQTQRTEYLLRLGDNALILSQRLCEWCGHAPMLEEDLALSNIALDLLGQARMWLDAAGRDMTPVKSEDDLAYLRDVQAFRNVLLVEQDKGNFADTQIRQFLFDSWHYLVLRELTNSSDEEIAAIASKALKEVTYHLRRSSRWVVRLGDGSPQSHELCRQAIERYEIYVNELFEMDELEQVIESQGIGCDLAALYPEWLTYVNDVLRNATLKPLHPTLALSGGKRGQHGEALVGLLMEMQFLVRAHPGAQW